jgi:hypothetical protein
MDFRGPGGAAMVFDPIDGFMFHHVFFKNEKTMPKMEN